MNELWIMVVGSNDKSRKICEGNMKEIESAAFDHSEEVIHDADKYFELSTPNKSYTFYSYRDFIALNLI